MTDSETPLGFGTILWLGVNETRGSFSTAQRSISIEENGITGDIYCSMWRKMSGHDVDYFDTDGSMRGDEALNLRQITIVDHFEVAAAAEEAGCVLSPGMLRENMVVHFTPHEQHGGLTFSALPPLSRMVIGKGKPKVLLLSEENGPCTGIVRPIAVHHKDATLDERLRTALMKRRGQMAMVRSRPSKVVDVGDPFSIFPPKV